MRRREFLRDSSLVALGLGAFGSIAWQGDRFVGNSPTATDILGPFYRPGAPLRQDLNPPDFRGRVLTLFGRIVGDDGRSPQVESVVETWQCKPDGFYDNVSDEFLYRGQQRTGKDGEYLFITTVPVPEPVDDARTIFRPAHIHLLISTPGQQDLITQVYFSGDPHLDTDPSTQAGLAINRVLTLERVDETSDRIRFDIRLRREYLPDEGGFRRVAGVYRMSDGSLMEFYRSGDLLFYRTNGQVWGGLSYQGENTFGGETDDTEARFALEPGGKATVLFRFSRRRETRLTGEKIFNYSRADRPDAG